MQIKKQTTNKIIIDHSSTKTSLDSILYGRKLRQKTSLEDFLEVVWKTSWKSSGRLLGSRLAHYILDD